MVLYTYIHQDYSCKAQAATTLATQKKDSRFPSGYNHRPFMYNTIFMKYVSHLTL